MIEQGAAPKYADPGYSWPTYTIPGNYVLRAIRRGVSGVMDCGAKEGIGTKTGHEAVFSIGIKSGITPKKGLPGIKKWKEE